jgi:probable biosynthetic protein (TIGR04098 family)
MARASNGGSRRAGGSANERRRYALNMPQMALGGLSESWLFKELGDMHWNMLTKGLGHPSHLLRDESGQRVYATFTRFQLNSTCPFTAYGENECVELDASMSRYGAGICFSEATVKGATDSVQAMLMSTFSRFGPAASNTSLLKGVPDIPSDCPIPTLPELPEFGRDYRACREQPLAPAIFECEYDIIPSHDINGVGLLYFAAYPTINDICTMRYAGRSSATAFSTIHRDVFYFGNSDPDDTLIYRLHDWTADEVSIEMRASLSRKSDGNLIARIFTRKVRSNRIAPEHGWHIKDTRRA